MPCDGVVKQNDFLHIKKKDDKFCRCNQQPTDPRDGLSHN